MLARVKQLLLTQTVKRYSYDGAGRTTAVTTSAGTRSLTYDYESRVTGITYPSTATNSFTYNGLDTRVGKVDSTGTYTYKRDRPPPRLWPASGADG